MNVLKGLEPQSVLKYFEEISQIPRGSGNEKGISDFLVNFGKSLGLETIQDESLNVIIRKPATPGYENAPGVIIQGHMDMVCEKNKDTIHDFEKDPIELRVDGDYIYATGTSLGADNGIAVAYGMAVLASNDIAHPAIELLVTTDEEVGMGGAIALDGTLLKGKYLLNIDSEEEGKLLVSCAGGAKAHVELPVSYEKAPEAHTLYSLTIKGLTGGHSGADIHKERANANILVGRMLDRIRCEIPLYIARFAGGSKDNVITREAEVSFYVSNAQKEALEKTIDEMTIAFKTEYAKQDPGLEVIFTTLQEEMEVLSLENTAKAIDLLMLLPHGITAYSMQIEGLVESSLNIGVAQLEKERFHLVLAVRSSVPTKKENMLRKIKLVSEALGAKATVNGDYPAWVYAPNSRIRELASEVFENMYHKQPKIEAIHAGLECGFILEKIPGIDMIAFGPNAYDIHSPEERASISSMARVYEYLVNLLKEMKNY